MPYHSWHSWRQRPGGAIAGTHRQSDVYAGVLPNTPENMLRWLQNPPVVDPLTAMPNVGVTEADARDMAGYLYTLR